MSAPTGLWIWFFAVGALLLIAGVAKAAERDPAILWAIVACLKQPEERGCYELAAYESRAECGVMLARVAVKVSGARLTCQQIDRVRR